MFRFTIRDVLWLMVVVGMGVVMWRDRRAIQAERSALEQQQASLQKERDSQLKTIVQEWVRLENATRRIGNLSPGYRIGQGDYSQIMHERALTQAAMVREADRLRSKQKSIELGAPQPAPLPPGYGEKPNSDATESAAALKQQ